MSDRRPTIVASARTPLAERELRDFEARLRDARGLAARAKVLRQLGERLAADDRRR